jgi:hypothetical protein
MGKVSQLPFKEYHYHEHHHHYGEEKHHHHNGSGHHHHHHNGNGHHHHSGHHHGHGHGHHDHQNQNGNHHDVVSAAAATNGDKSNAHIEISRINGGSGKSYRIMMIPDEQNSSSSSSPSNDRYSIPIMQEPCIPLSLLRQYMRPVALPQQIMPDQCVTVTSVCREIVL